MDNKKKKERFVILSARLLIRDTLYKLDPQKPVFSKWLFAGAIAFIYTVVSDPQGAIEAYGPVKAKVSVFLLATSCWYGAKTILASTISKTVEEGKLINALTTMYDSLDEEDKGTTKAIDKSDGPYYPSLSDQEFQEKNFKAIFSELGFHFKYSSSLILQLVFFGLGIATVLLGFFLYTPPPLQNPSTAFRTKPIKAGAATELVSREIRFPHQCSRRECSPKWLDLGVNEAISTEARSGRFRK